MSLITSVAEANALRKRTTETGKAASFSAPEISGSFRDVFGSKLKTVSEDMDQIFEEAADRFGISSRLLRAVAKAESNFNPRAVSHAGAMGVMQLMPSTAKNLGVADPYDARQNIMGGAKYLKENLDKFGDVRLALAAYNAGPGAVQKYGGVPPYSETQNYVKKIMADLTGDTTIYANRTVDTGGSQSSALAQLYALSGLGGASRLGSMDSSYGSSSGYGSSLSGLGGLYGSSSLGSLSGLPGSGYGSGSALGLALADSSWTSGFALSDDGDTITMDKDSYMNLIQMLRMQMLMTASREVGSLSL